MLPKNQQAIIELFRKDIFLAKTIRGLSKTLRKSYPKIYDAVLELGKNNILFIEKIGNSKICKLKLSPESISFLSFIESQEALTKRIPNVNKILNFKDFLDDIFIVTGSYAKGKQTKSSDIDIALIAKENPKNKQELLANLTMTFIPQIHALSFSYKDFIDMLLDKEANFGKEVFKYHLIFRNPERYYELIKEAIEHGFRG